jgi:DNA mismatch repair protein MutL
MRIHLLPDSVINKIAAGEVVDRPASVVKELVENALDAGATRIEVLLENGGRTLIEVRDNGHGMGKEDAVMAFERHATSKVESDADLFSISSHGFRGEALPSIASIAKLELKTRTVDDECGWMVQIHGGKIVSVKPSPCAVGTTVRVARLFFNTPVRRKFLRSDNYEASRVRVSLRNIALANPKVSFQLGENGRVVFFIPEHSDFFARASSQFRGTTMRVESSPDANAQVRGLVAHPSMAEADHEGFVLLVNGRVVRDRLLQKAVREGFHHTLKAKEHPVGVLDISLPPDQVDVNVHPQKAEVRFVQAQQIFKCVAESVHQALVRFKSPIPLEVHQAVWSVGNSSVHSQPPSYSISKLGTTDTVDASRVQGPTLGQIVGSIGAQSAAIGEQQHSGYEYPGSTLADREPRSARMLAFDTRSLIEESHKFAKMRFLGQVSACFLLFEDVADLVVMDMHAAHERINYARILAQVKSGGVKSQPLLVPFRIHVGEDSVEGLRERIEELCQCGFEISCLDSGDVMVHAEPILSLRKQISRSDLSAMFKEMARKQFWESSEYGFQELVSGLVARCACHDSVRSGDRLMDSEVVQLCCDLDSVDLAAACPHGRPVSVRFSRRAMESWFGRDN